MIDPSVGVTSTSEFDSCAEIITFEEIGYKAPKNENFERVMEVIYDLL